MTPVLLRSGRHPVVTGLLIALFAISVYGLTTSPPTKAVDLALPYPQRLVWSGQVMVASAVTLAGLWLQKRRPELGLLVEGIGYALIVVGLGCYDAMLYHTTPWPSAGFVFCLVAGIASGAAVRIGFIAVDLGAHMRLARVLVGDGQ